MAEKEKFLNDVGLSHVIDKTKELLDKKVDIDSSVVYASENGAIEVDIVVEDVEAALSKKVDKVAGKGLSENDFTDEHKTTVDKLISTDLRPEGSVYTDFDASTNVAEIKHINAHALEGHAASYFATADSVENITNGLTIVGKADNSNQLGGESADVWQEKIENASIRVSETEPSNTSIIWWDTTTNLIKRYANGVWIAAANT